MWSPCTVPPSSAENLKALSLFSRCFLHRMVQEPTF